MEHRPPRRRRRTAQLTDRDRELLAFAAEHRFVIAAQLALRLGVSRSAAEARIRALRGAGYLRSEQRLYGEPASHRVTGAGLRAIGSDLPAARRVDLALYHHDLGLGWLMLAAHRGRFGALEQVVSERRMRSHDGRAPEDGERFGVRLGGVGPGGSERLHYPDMLMVTSSGHRVAFELELTGKERDRRERILSAYAADRRIDAVVYLVTDARVGAALERSAARVGAAGLVAVQPVTLTTGGGRDRGGSARSRHPARAGADRERAAASGDAAEAGR